MKYEVRKAANVFLYGSFVELVPIGPIDVEAPPFRHSCESIDCLDCWNRSVKYADWKKERALNGR